MRVIPPESERHFQSRVVAAARMFGWAVHFTLRSMGSPSGWPDLTLLRPPRMLVRELKTEQGRLLPAQKRTIALLAACRVDVGVWRPSDWRRIVAELQEE